MQSFKTQGIVLKGSNFGEADKILTIFTERFGKIKVIAKGIRKIKSHLAGALEPFILSDLQLHEGKTFYIVTGASIVEDFPKIKGDINQIAKAFFVGELIDNFASESERLIEIFALFLATLKELNGPNRPVILQAFQLKLVEAAGFKPELYHCLHCKKEIVPNQNFWDDQEGGLICFACHTQTHHGFPVTDQFIKLMHFFERSDLSEIRRMNISEQLGAEMEKNLENYLHHLLEKELKSSRFIKLLHNEKHKDNKCEE